MLPSVPKSTLPALPRGDAAFALLQLPGRYSRCFIHMTFPDDGSTQGTEATQKFLLTELRSTLSFNTVSDQSLSQSTFSSRKTSLNKQKIK